jgi:hypothetical protein
MASEPRILRPLSIPELFDEIFSLYRNNFVLFAGIVGLITLPLTILTVLILRPAFDPSTTAVTTETLQTVLQSSVLLIFIAWLVGGIQVAALTKAVSERYLGHQINIFGAYQFALARYLPFFGTLFLVGLVTLLGFFLLIVPGIIAIFWFALVYPVFVVEGETFGRAMGRSRELAKHNWFKILLIFILGGGLNWLSQLGAESITGMIMGADPTGTYLLVLVFLQTVFAMLIQPIGLIGFVVLYFDIRVRDEGYDLEMLARDMGSNTSEATP